MFLTPWTIVNPVHDLFSTTKNDDALKNWCYGRQLMKGSASLLSELHLFYRMLIMLCRPQFFKNFVCRFQLCVACNRSYFVLMKIYLEFFLI